MNDDDNEYILVDHDGRPVPVTPAAFEALLHQCLAHGELVFVLVRLPTGGIIGHALEPPTAAGLKALRQSAEAYATVLRGHA